MSIATAEVSAQPRETTRNVNQAEFHALSAAQKAQRFYSQILLRLAPEGTAKEVARVLDLSEPTISRAKETLEHGCAVIAALGYKIVDARKTCVDPGEIGSLRKLRRRVEDHAPHLLDEEGGE